MGGLSVDITGGEPLLREDALDILGAARNAKLHVRLLSNGSMLRDTDLSKQVSEAADEVILSLDGLRDTHEWLRGGGQFDEVVEAARLLVSLGSRVGITTLITSKSLAELSRIAELLVGLEVERWNLNLPRIVGRADETFCDESLRSYYSDTGKTLGMLRNAYETAAGAGIQVMGEPSMFSREITQGISRDDDALYRLYDEGQVCWNPTLGVHSNGNVVPCLFYTDVVYGNVKDTSLKLLYESELRKELGEEFRCRACNGICPYIAAKGDTTRLREIVESFVG